MISGTFYALLAGFLGAVASTSAKLSLGAEYLKDMCATEMRRLMCGGLLFSSNAVMWTFFSKALRYSSSSARATVTTTAANFISSAILGKVIFGETHTVLWWVGISITLTGLLVLHGATSQTFPLEEDKKK